MLGFHDRKKRANSETNILDLVDGRTDASLTEAVVVVSAVLASSLTRHPDVLLVQSVGHGQTLAETPAE